MLILQLAIIFMFLGLGELFVALTAIPVPSSIIGMLLLTASLKMGLVDIHSVDKAASLLVDNMAVLFVPAGVGLMRCFGLLRDQWMPIVAAMVVSTFVIIAVTGHVHTLVRRRLSRRKEVSQYA